MTDAEFEKLVAEGLDALPERVQKHMANVAVTVADDVTDAERKEYDLGPNETLFGHYYGVPLTERDTHYVSLPDKITIFAGPVLRVSQDAEMVKQKVAQVVKHEIAHHFGLSEVEVRRAERP